MFFRSRPVSFSRYEQRRSRWALPRWLWLLLGGAALGVGGMVYLQAEVLPPRLSVDASGRLNAAYVQAEGERTRLDQALRAANRQLQAAVEGRQGLDKDLASSRAQVERLTGDLAALVNALPPDPRAGTVAVRATRFAFSDGQLVYDVVLSREQATGKAMTGVLQLVVTGNSAQGSEAAVTLPALAVTLGAQAVLHGTQPLPEGFKPRQTTVRVLGGPAGPLLGMRVGLVR